MTVYLLNEMHTYTHETSPPPRALTVERCLRVEYRVRVNINRIIIINLLILTLLYFPASSGQAVITGVVQIFPPVLAFNFYCA